MGLNLTSSLGIKSYMSGYVLIDTLYSVDQVL